MKAQFEHLPLVSEISVSDCRKRCVGGSHNRSPSQIDKSKTAIKSPELVQVLPKKKSHDKRAKEGDTSQFLRKDCALPLAVGHSPSSARRKNSPYKLRPRRKTVAFGRTVSFAHTVEAKDEQRRLQYSKTGTIMNVKDHIKKLAEIVEEQGKEIKQLQNLETSVRCLESTVRLNAQQTSHVAEILNKLTTNLQISNKQIDRSKIRETSDSGLKGQNPGYCDSATLASFEDNKENQNQKNDNEEKGSRGIDLERMVDMQRLFLPKSNGQNSESVQRASDQPLDAKCWSLLKQKAEQNKELKRELVSLVMKHAGDDSLADFGHSHTVPKENGCESPRSYRTTKRTVTLAEEVTVRDSPQRSLRFSHGERQFLTKYGMDANGHRRSPDNEAGTAVVRGQETCRRRVPMYNQTKKRYDEQYEKEVGEDNLYSDEDERLLFQSNEPRYGVHEYDSGQCRRQEPVCRCRRCYH